MNNWNFEVLPHDQYNMELLNNVHPADWQNPEPQPIYNLVVVGAGTAGLISAIATAALGGKVALVERHLMGGDCLNVGCVPSKSLIRPARLAAEMKRASEFGLTGNEATKEDFPKVMERLRRIRAGISKNDSVKRYHEMGVDVFIGEGRFSAQDVLEVNDKKLRFKKAVIATGARAVHPEYPGLDETGFYTNETIFNLTERPDHLIVIGGGPIACEISQAFRRLGSLVTVIQRSRFLSREDQEAAALLADVFAKEGIDVRLNTNIVRIERADAGNWRIVVECDGEEQSVVGDKILVGVGRAPNVEGLGLETAGVEYDLRHGIKVNDFLQSSNKRIYAAGDCCMNWKFTHAADAAAQIAVKNALFMGRNRLSKLNMPWCTYTDPEIAHVGMYEHDANAKNIETDTYKFNMAENDRALADGEDCGFVKVLVKKGTGKILGATIVSTHAGEMISEITTAMAGKMDLGRLGGVIHPYPTQAEAIKRVADLYNKSRLTPFIAGLIRRWLRFQLH
jgi:pyruvate/2-oxoglutarate dehydrogenase complex dihydrolipoamide dehydrogenase (E3) component